MVLFFALPSLERNLLIYHTLNDRNASKWSPQAGLHKHSMQSALSRRGKSFHNKLASYENVQKHMDSQHWELNPHTPLNELEETMNCYSNFHIFHAIILFTFIKSSIELILAVLIGPSVLLKICKMLRWVYDLIILK